MPDLFHTLLNRTDPVELPDLPPQPPGYGFTASDKPDHFVPKVAVTDFREGVDPRKSFTGKYPSNIINELILGAKKAGVDPSIALSVGLQESNLGTAGIAGGTRANPMMLNPVTKMKPGMTGGPFPSDTLLGNMDDNQTSQEARDAMDREWSVGEAMKHLRGDINKFPGNLEHGLQAYNGLGKPDYRIGSYGGHASAQLPTDFYGKRVLDLKSNIIDKNPLITEMINRIH